MRYDDEEQQYLEDVSMEGEALNEIAIQEAKDEDDFLRNLSEEERQLADYIIGNIDDDGYLRRDLMAISDDLAFNMNMDVSEELLLKILLEMNIFV